MITKKDIETEFDNWYRDQKDMNPYIMRDYFMRIPLSLLESLEKDVSKKIAMMEVRGRSSDVLWEVLSLIKQYKEQLK